MNQDKPREWFAVLEDESDDGQSSGCINTHNMQQSNQFKVIEKSAYDTLAAKLAKSEEMLGKAAQAIKDAEFILEGSCAFPGQSDTVMEKRVNALERFLKTFEELKAYREGK